MSSLQLVITGDGSHTLYNPQLDETYHSRNGALTESRHIFINHGLKYYLNNHRDCRTISVFEMGFGTGLNALLALQFAINNTTHIQYHGVESAPLDMGIVEELNFPEIMKWPDGRQYLAKLHTAEWDMWQTLHPQFNLKKTEISIENYEPEADAYQVIFYDAFAPSKQRSVWDIALLRKMYISLSDGGILTTYCARGQFKRDLDTLGFTVDTLPGPPGKNEMVRAIKTGL
jgi:tRNA U34 5-methylaminomethyl-2-thiouridine-forming methyltransferase MnmC